MNYKAIYFIYIPFSANASYYENSYISLSLNSETLKIIPAYSDFDLGSYFEESDNFEIDSKKLIDIIFGTIFDNINLYALDDDNYPITICYSKFFDNKILYHGSSFDIVNEKELDQKSKLLEIKEFSTYIVNDIIKQKERNIKIVVLTDINPCEF